MGAEVLSKQPFALSRRAEMGLQAFALFAIACGIAMAVLGAMDDGPACKVVSLKRATILSNPMGLSDCQVQVSSGGTVRKVYDPMCDIARVAIHGDVVDLAVCDERSYLVWVRGRAVMAREPGGATAIPYVFALILVGCGVLTIWSLRRERARAAAAPPPS